VEEVNIRHVHIAAPEDYYQNILQFLLHTPSQRASFKSIESSTSTQINIPKNASGTPNAGRIEIVGKRRDDVDIARRQVENILLQLVSDYIISFLTH
jgi:hypothetical protein